LSLIYDGCVFPFPAAVEGGSSSTGAPPATMSQVGAGVAAVLLLIALAAAVSVDVVRTGFGIKGDEATYGAMALSLAYDRDLSYERQDLERFWRLYRSGPEGIFLKRGKQLRIRLRAAPPFVSELKSPDPRSNRLYFGKAFIYPLAVAPFVRVAGLNGFLVFHVLLIFGVCVCAYRFLAARARAGPALLFTLAFVGAAVVPVYVVFLTSDIFNFALVFFAYFLWLYKEVVPPDRARWLHGLGSDVGAAILLGLVTYSKPSHILLIGPVVMLLWWRRRLLPGVVVGAIFMVTTAGLYGVNAWNSGEFNYQGGDRKTFYGHFPFDAPDGTWDNRGIPMATDDSDAGTVLDQSEFVNRFAHNLEYFLIGRHFGFVPYFFPGVVVLALWMFSRDRFVAWRVCSLLGLVGSTSAMLIFFPYTWSGGGGPPGNRYFLSFYPVVFFLTPPLTSVSAPLVAWAVGALFTAKMVINPFVAAKFTYQAPARGAVRGLPVELTMANDLPIRLDPSRSRIPYAHDPTVFLYFLDDNAFTPEPAGMWISGSGRADILVRSENRLHHLAVTAMSPIRTVLTVSAGGSTTSVRLMPGKAVVFDLPTHGVRGLQSYAYLLSARSSEGFIPQLQDPKSTDPRNLGALIRFSAVEARTDGH
jgi:hypothetical protein